MISEIIMAGKPDSLYKIVGIARDKTNTIKVRWSNHTSPYSALKNNGDTDILLVTLSEPLNKLHGAMFLKHRVTELHNEENLEAINKYIQAHI